MSHNNSGSNNFFENKRFWIVGASSGIGRALALELAARGAIVVASARTLKALEDLAAQSEQIKPFELDVAAEGALEDAVAKLQEANEFPDSIVYLSAFYNPSSIHKIGSDDLATTVKVNLWAAMELVRLILPLFYAKRAGQIALVGSVAGYRGLPKGQPYSATKAALINFAESLKLEAKSKNVDVKLISPGFVETPMTQKNAFVMPDIISTEAAASAIADGLETSKFEIHFPKRFTRKLKLLRLLPYWLYFKLVKVK